MIFKLLAVSAKAEARSSRLAAGLMRRSSGERGQGSPLRRGCSVKGTGHLINSFQGSRLTLVGSRSDLNVHSQNPVFLFGSQNGQVSIPRGAPTLLVPGVDSGCVFAIDTSVKGVYLHCGSVVSSGLLTVYRLSEDINVLNLCAISESVVLSFDSIQMEDSRLVSVSSVLACLNTLTDSLSRSGDATASKRGLDETLAFVSQAFDANVVNWLILKDGAALAAFEDRQESQLMPSSAPSSPLVTPASSRKGSFAPSWISINFGSGSVLSSLNCYVCVVDDMSSNVQIVLKVVLGSEHFLGAKGYNSYSALLSSLSEPRASFFDQKKPSGCVFLIDETLESGKKGHDLIGPLEAYFESIEMPFLLGAFSADNGVYDAYKSSYVNGTRQSGLDFDQDKSFRRASFLGTLKSINPG